VHFTGIRDCVVRVHYNWAPLVELRASPPVLSMCEPVKIFLGSKFSYLLFFNCTHLSMKEGSLFVLFCLYLWDPPNQDASDCVLGLFGKLSRRRGASAWFHSIWICGVEVLEYWMISCLTIKLNRIWKFWRNWNVPILLERSWWAGFNGIYLVRFGFRRQEILIFKWFFPWKCK
jgi:hypothetical protein